MSVFKQRQTVKKRRQWVRRLRQLERVLISLAIVMAGLASIYGLYRLVCFGDAFAIDNVVVEGKFKHLSSGEIVSISQVSRGDNMFWISMEGIHKRLRENPWVRNAAVRRGLPDTLYIFVEEHNPRALVSGETIFMVDEYGEVFKPLEENDHKNYPVFTGLIIDENGRMDAVHEEALSRMLGLLRTFESSAMGAKFGVSEVSYDEIKGISVVTENSPMQILFGHAAFEEQMAKLERMGDAVMKRAGRITYILANEPGRLIVSYQTS